MTHPYISRNISRIEPKADRARERTAIESTALSFQRMVHPEMSDEDILAQYCTPEYLRHVETQIREAYEEELLRPHIFPT